MRFLPVLPLWFPVLLQLGPSYALPTQELLVPPRNGARGAVASESSICSKIGVDIIGIGGTAADATVASTLCVGVVGMYHSGIGGGGFMLVRDEKGRYEVIDYRESAPAASHRDMYKHDKNASIVGGLAVGIPGEIRGLEYLHEKYGRLPWHVVVRPAIRVAREGFVVNEDLVRYMDRVGGNTSFLVTDPVWAEDFAPNGTLVKFGDIMTRKRFADTLEVVAQHGPNAFYRGPIAESIIKTTAKTGGIMTLDDLKQYTVKAKKALTINYRGYKLFTTDAPSGGAVMLSILNTMKEYPHEDVSNQNLTSHRFVEAMKFAYGARQELGDPDFVGNIKGLQQQMLSAEKAKEIRNLILDNATLPMSAYNPQAVYTVDSQGTSHIVTADGSGMTISSTTTVNLLFGAQIMTHDTGIILNNEMDDFSQPGRRNSFGFEPSPANFIAPGKRPLSSICPIIVEFANGTVFFTTGAAGGSRIISATAQSSFRVLEEGLSMYSSVAAPRLHDQLMPETTLVEEGYEEAIYVSLGEKQHNVTWVAPGQSAVQAIMRLADGVFDAVGETRQLNSGGWVI